MCADFNDLNEACPKYHYLIPNLNSMVNAMAGHALLSFMDAFPGYNKILM